MFDRQTQEDTEALISSIGRELAELQAAHDDSDNALAEHLGIGRTDLRCLDLIVRHGPQSSGKLARSLNLTPGSVTALVDRLEASGYARRQPDPTHGKRILVVPTNRLVELLEPIISERVSRGRTQLLFYSSGELDLIHKFLAGVRENHTQSAKGLRGMNDSRGIELQ